MNKLIEGSVNNMIWWLLCMHINKIWMIHPNHKQLQITEFQTTITSENVAESPFITMQILGYQLLGRRLLGHVLSKNQHKVYSVDWSEAKRKEIISKDRKQTSGGRHSSACLLNTEKPPWVLVSEAVRVLQKECTRGRGEWVSTSTSFVDVSSCWHGTTITSLEFELSPRIQNWYQFQIGIKNKCTRFFLKLHSCHFIYFHNFSGELLDIFHPIVF